MKISDNILSKENLPRIADYDSLRNIASEPTLKYDMGVVGTLSSLNQSLMNTIDLSNYSSLQNRFSTNQIMPVEEYAGFLSDTGIDPNTVSSLFLDNFPTKLDIGLISKLKGSNFSSGSVIPGSGVGINNTNELINIINTGGGLQKVLGEYGIANIDIGSGAPLLSIGAVSVFDIKEVGGNQVGSILANGNIVNAKDRILGSITSANEITDSAGNVLINSAGTVLDSKTGVLTDSPIIDGDNPGSTGITGSVEDVDTTENTTSPFVSEVDEINPIVPQRYIPDVGTEDITAWQPTEAMVRYLTIQNVYYRGIEIGGVTGSVCEYPDPFVREVPSLIAESAGQLEFDLYTQIVGKTDIEVNSGFAILEPYDEAVNLALEKIHEIREERLKQVEMIKENVDNFINDIVGDERLYRHCNKKYKHISSLLSEINMEYFRRKLANISNSDRMVFDDPAMLEGVEYYSENVLNLLLLKICRVIKDIEEEIVLEVMKYKLLSDKIVMSYYSAEAKSISVSRLAQQAGALRLSPKQKHQEAEKHAETYNTSVKGSNAGTVAPSIHVATPMKESEKKEIITLTEEGTDAFIFEESVKSMGFIAREFYLRGANGIVGHEDEWDEAQNYAEAGWKMIAEKNPSIYSALNRVGRRLQDAGYLGGPLTLNSCYRSPYYNRVYLRQFKGLNASKNSTHMNAIAVDISTRGMSNLGTAKLIEFASQEGFNRINVYNTFIHVDIKGGSYRGDWDRFYRNNRDIELAMALHKTYQFTEGKTA
jgi:hypothetical protein